MELDYPDEGNLRNDLFQQCLYKIVFKENVLKHKPPLRYQLRVLKELTRRIESSIHDWEEEVSIKYFFPSQFCSSCISVQIVLL